MCYSPPFDTYAIQCLKFLSQVVGCRSYQMSDARIAVAGRSTTGKLSQVTPEAVREGAASVAAFFSPECCTNLVRFLIERCLSLRPDELEDWGADPEEYVMAQTAETAEESVRAAASDLYLALLDYKSELLPVVVRWRFVCAYK